MKIVKTVSEMQKIADNFRCQGHTIGFVPTMGYLHDGHLSLVKGSIFNNARTVVSIFVNPTQFSENEDLDDYPRDLDRDIELLEKENVDILFYPPVQEIYTGNEEMEFKIKKIDQIMCGKTRPKHFAGVVQVCSKLFNIVKPHNIYFGQKDYQQCLVVKKLIGDLNFDILMNILPTVREHDGLAMSSRNYYLSEKERKMAPVLKKSLDYVHDLILKGEKKVDKLVKLWNSYLTKASFSDVLEIDYLEIRRKSNLEKLESIIDKDCILALAVKVGETRLTDNVLL